MGDSGIVDSNEYEDLKKKLVEILRTEGITDEVENVEIREPPELHGEHMATATVYAKITFKDRDQKSKNFFVKKFPRNKIHCEMIKVMRIMEKESAFYNEYLPFARKFCKDHKGCENLLNFFPKCVYADDEIVVLENLVVDDSFIMLDKEERQDLFTAKFVLRNLAKLHATSFAIIQIMGRDAFRQKFKLSTIEAFDTEQNPAMAGMFDNGVRNCINILNGITDVDGKSETIDRLTDMIGESAGEMQKLLKNSPKDLFLVLNHGDCWNNNMLFKMGPNNIVNDHIFVDFQVTRFGSPNLDIGYFFFTSVKPSIRQTCLIELLEEYFSQFQQTAEQLRQKCPISFEEFVLDYKKYCKLGFIISLHFISAIGAFKDVDLETLDISDMDKMIETFNKHICDWLAANSAKAKSIALEIIGTVAEFHNLLPI